MSDLLPFDAPEDVPRIDGQTFDRAKDGVRLGKQALRLFAFMKGGGWWSLHELSRYTADPEASLSARMRDFRKDRFGAHTIERRRRVEAGGTWEYRLVVNPQQDLIR